MLTNDEKLDALVKQALEAFNALPEERKREHRREQAISWAFGEAMMTSLERGEAISEEEAAIIKQRISDAYDRKNAYHERIQRHQYLH